MDNVQHLNKLIAGGGISLLSVQQLPDNGICFHLDTDFGCGYVEVSEIRHIIFPD